MAGAVDLDDLVSSGDEGGGQSDFLNTSERVSCAVGEDRGHRDAWQVLGAGTFGLPGRMQRVREQGKHIKVQAVVSNGHRGEASTVGVAAGNNG